jgi:RNA methyltransferase, TrmH family
MISIAKLKTLPRKTRLRKIITIIQDMEYRLSPPSAARGPVDTEYLGHILNILAEEPKLPAWLREKMSREDLLLRTAASPATEPEGLRRLCNDVRTGLQQYFGIEPADWDFFDTDRGGLAADKRTVLPFTVFLEDLRSPFNVGSIFRTAESFGVEKIYLTPSVPTPEHKRVRRTAMGCTGVIPWEQREIGGRGGMNNVFALETGGTPLEKFPFPAEGTVILGSEELGISPEAAEIAAAGLGRVSIPTAGVKGSLNVSVAFGILMHAWYSRITGTL